MARITGIHHGAFVTGDLERTTRFWRDLIGLPLVYSLGEAGRRQYFFAAGSGAFLTFFEQPGVPPLPPRRPGAPNAAPQGFDHLAIGVERREDLWDLMARLEAAGFAASDVIDHGLNLSLYSFDPNGIAIEFAWARPNIDLLARPRLAGGPVPPPGHWPAPEPLAESERRIEPGDGADHFPEAAP